MEILIPILYIALIVGSWVVLQRFILPRLGVKT